MRFTVKVEWQQEDGRVATVELGRIDSDGLNSATDLGLKLSDTKPLLAQLQNIVTTVQVLSYLPGGAKVPFVSGATKDQGLQREATGQHLWHGCSESSAIRTPPDM